MKRIGIDIDGTLVKEGPAADRAYAEPIKSCLVSQLHRAIEAGHQVTIFSARPWSEYRMTVDQLTKLGVPFTNVVLGKPNFDLLIDDRASPSPETLKSFLNEHEDD